MKIKRLHDFDIKNFINLRSRLDKETQFMLKGPNESLQVNDKNIQRLKNMLKDRSQIIFVAEDNHNLVGFAGAQGSKLSKIRHKAKIVVGVCQSHARLGLGTKLLTQVEK